MRRVMGPILGFRGQQGGNWQVCALLVTGADADPKLIWSVEGEGEVHEMARQEAGRSLLKTYQNRKVWRFDWKVPQNTGSKTVRYTAGDTETFQFTVPGQHQPPHIAYTSCSDFQYKKDIKKIKALNVMWERLAAEHDKKPYHLLIMGGDQVYADDVWDVRIIESLKGVLELPYDERNNEKLSEEMRIEIEGFYFNLYCDKWKQNEPAKCLAQIPTIMIWDDHDIFDGWGSYPPEQQSSDVFQRIYEIAREHYCLFQLQVTEGESLPASLLKSREKGRNLSCVHCIGNIAIAALDMRTERTQDQVMSDATWKAFYAWLDSDELRSCQHLLLMSSIPVVYPSLNWLESMLGIFPGQQEIEDDFKDRWSSRTHLCERLRLIHRLLEFSERCRVTIISGDVHIGALGYIQSERGGNPHDAANVINQLISSALVNAPPGVMINMLKVLSHKVEEIDRGITAQMVEFPASDQRFIAARNYLDLTVDEKNRIWAEWHVEGEKHPYTKVIHPVTGRGEDTR